MHYITLYKAKIKKQLRNNCEYFAATWDSLISAQPDTQGRASGVW